MRLKIILVLTAFLMSVFLAACGSTSTSDKLDVEQYREKVRESRIKNGFDPEKAKAAKKSIFPNLKENSD